MNIPSPAELAQMARLSQMMMTAGARMPAPDPALVAQLRASAIQQHNVNSRPGFGALNPAAALGMPPQMISQMTPRLPVQQDRMFQQMGAQRPQNPREQDPRYSLLAFVGSKSF